MTHHTVASIAAHVGGTVVGPADGTITGVAELRSAGPGDVGFVREVKYRDHLTGCHAGAVLVAEELDTPRPQIVVADVYLAFAQVADLFHPLPRAVEHRIHETAAIDPDAVLQAPLDIGAFAVVHAGVRLGKGSVVGDGVVVGPDSALGEDCVLYARVTLYGRVTLGDRVVVHSGTVLGADGFGFAKDGPRYVKLPQVGGVVIGDDVEIGANCTIDCGTLGDTVIGRGTKIDNLVHIAHNCAIGEDVVVAGCSALSGSTVLGDRVVIGGHVVSAGHMKVVNEARIGGNSVLHGDVREPGDYMGYPLMDKAKWARLLCVQRELVDIYKKVKPLARRRSTGE